MSLDNGVSLLTAMSASPSFSSGPPSSDLLSLIDRVEQASPDDPDISSDDTNESWGHAQFTGGSLVLSNLIKTWDDVGDVATARRLLAGAIKTCKVARHLCFKRSISSSSYIADIYFEKSVDQLWNAWKASNGVSDSEVHILGLYLISKSMLSLF